ncbi:MAG: hypothetical protein ACFFDT_19745 [Candidatus Hodarchaeota archaeon]
MSVENTTASNSTISVFGSISGPLMNAGQNLIIFTYGHRTFITLISAVSLIVLHKVSLFNKFIHPKRKLR